MNVTIDVRDLDRFPPIRGPHELSWSYILDAIFSDAYNAGVDRIVCTLPSRDLVHAVELRAELTSLKPGSTGGVAVAHLAGPGLACQDCVRTYMLTLGAIAPPHLRSVMGRVATKRRPTATLSVFTVAARLLGVPLRAYALARLSCRHQRAISVMRQHFARSGMSPAYYHLYTWRV